MPADERVDVHSGQNAAHSKQIETGSVPIRMTLAGRVWEFNTNAVQNTSS